MTVAITLSRWSHAPARRGQHPSTWISEGEHKPRQMIVTCEVAVSRFATAKPVKASSASGADSDSEGSHPF